MRVCGRIGLLDAYLASCLWELSERDRELELILTGALYPDLVSEADLVTMLGGLRCLSHVHSSAGRSFLPLPEQELAFLTRRHIRAGRPVPCQKSLVGPDLRISEQELLSLYGDRPGRRDQPLVAISGCFDVLHANHYRLFAAARQLAPQGMLLVITLSDQSITRLDKNILGDRPVYPQECRVRLLSALRDVTHVLVLDEADCRRALARLGVDLYVKNGRDLHRPVIEAEADAVAARGGRTVFIGESNTELSTTSLIAALSAYNCTWPSDEGGR